MASMLATPFTKADRREILRSRIHNKTMSTLLYQVISPAGDWDRKTRDYIEIIVEGEIKKNFIIKNILKLKGDFVLLK